MNTLHIITRSSRIPGVLASLLLTALPLSAAVLVKADFDSGYFPASIAGQSASSSDKGLTGAWKMNPGGNFAIVEGGLSYTVKDGGTISGGPQALQYTYGGEANAKDGAYISLRSDITTDFYIRLLINVETPAPLDSTSLFLWLSNNATSNHLGGHPGVGIYDSKLAAQAFLGSGEGVSSRTEGQTIKPGTTYLVVAKIGKRNGASKYNSAAIWINPSYKDRKKPLFDVTGTGTNVTNINLIGFQFGNMADNGDDPKYRIDGIAIGTSWSDVMPSR